MMYRLGDAAPVLEGEGHYVAEGAVLIGRVRLMAGASIWFNAVLRGDNDRIEIGRDSNIQDGSILHTDPGLPLVVGDRVTVGHRAMLHGCTIGDGSLIGIGSTILNRARIGRRCLVGAHALITEGREFPDSVLILGAPARVERDLTGDELDMLSAATDNYVRNRQRFLADLELLGTR